MAFTVILSQEKGIFPSTQTPIIPNATGCDHDPAAQHMPRKFAAVPDSLRAHSLFP
jgi:hypothetical protein